MLELGPPVLFAALLWWAGTGLILWLDGLDRRTHPLSLMLAGLAALAAFAALALTRSGAAAADAYIAFAAAIAIWGFNELVFLMGYVTGPRRVAADGRARGLARFREAAETVLWHEIMLALSGLLVAAVLWGQANPVGLWTFAVLWAMRLSAKLNVFLGAPNVTVEFLPANLAYLGTYFRNRPMNGFFPLGITAATLVTAWLFQQAAGAGEPFGAAAYGLAAALMALAVLEHWLLFIPLSTVWLWRWGLGDRPRAVALREDARAGGLQ